MELTSRQLAKVKVYIAGDCKYPDMQLAVTQHIKYRIQDLMTDDLNLHLDDAIAIAHNEFGKNNFKVFEVCIKAASKNKYGKLLWQIFPTNFRGKYLLAGIVIMLWSYLFFADVRPPKIGVWYAILLVNFPQYLISFPMMFKPGKRYRWYYTLASCNSAMSPWSFILGALMMLAWFNLCIWGDGKNALLCGLLLGFIGYSGLIGIRTGYIVRKAAIQDCREIEKQLDEIHA